MVTLIVVLVGMRVKRRPDSPLFCQVPRLFEVKPLSVAAKVAIGLGFSTSLAIMSWTVPVNPAKRAQ
jgi:hypothetical protein